MKAMKAMKATAVAAAVIGLLAAAPVLATGGMPEPWQLNMTPGVTDTAAAAYKMHMIMLWVCVVIGVIVFGAMGYAMFKFRKSQGAVPDTSFVHSTKIEIIWTAVPVLILIGMAYPATAYLVQAMDTRDAEMTVKITGGPAAAGQLPVQPRLRLEQGAPGLHRPGRGQGR